MTSQRIIRAQDAKELTEDIQYNYLDLQQRCEQHLEKVRTQTRQMIIEAEKEIQKIKDQAKTEGVKEGERQGMSDAQKKIAQQAEQKIAAEMKTILPAFQQVITQIKDEQQRCIASWEQEVIALSCLIAEKIIRRELTVKPMDSLTLVKELLQQTVGQTVVSINLSPQDYSVLEGYQQKGQLPFSKEQFALIQQHKEIAPGGCLVQTVNGEINATVEKQLERIVEELCPGHD